MFCSLFRAYLFDTWTLFLAVLCCLNRLSIFNKAIQISQDTQWMSAPLYRPLGDCTGCSSSLCVTHGNNKGVISGRHMSLTTPSCDQCVLHKSHKASVTHIQQYHTLKRCDRCAASIKSGTNKHRHMTGIGGMCNYGLVKCVGLNKARNV